MNADNLLRIILEEINKKGYTLRPRMRAGSVWVCCPFHNEKTPSMRVNLDRSNGRLGSVYCFGCDEGRGTWNKFAKKAGIKQLSDDDFSDTSAYKKVTRKRLALESSLKDVTTSILSNSFNTHIKFNLDFVIEGKRWRNIKKTLLQDLNCFTFIDANLVSPTAYLYLPVMVYGKQVGAIKASIEKEEGKLSYVNSSGSWSTQSGLFPFDYTLDLIKENNLDYVLLVEGPRDALRLLQNGIPALSILGVNSWSDNKRDLLLSLNVSTVVLCMDGDKVGRQMNTKLKEKLVRYTNVTIFSLWNIKRKLGLRKVDPADMPLEYLSIIKDKYCK